MRSRHGSDCAVKILPRGAEMKLWFCSQCKDVRGPSPDNKCESCRSSMSHVTVVVDWDRVKRDLVESWQTPRGKEMTLTELAEAYRSAVEAELAAKQKVKEANDALAEAEKRLSSCAAATYQARESVLDAASGGSRATDAYRVPLFMGGSVV
jgi:hypothetical protein